MRVFHIQKEKERDIETKRQKDEERTTYVTGIWLHQRSRQIRFFFLRK